MCLNLDIKVNFDYCTQLKRMKGLFLTLIIQFDISRLFHTVRYLTHRWTPYRYGPGVIEYTYCFSAEGLDSPCKCPGYDIKRSNEEALVMLELWSM